MTPLPFYGLFIDLLRELYDAEIQIAQFFSKSLSFSSHPKLTEVLEEHVEDTRHRIDGLKEIFTTLQENPTGIESKAIKALAAQCEELIKKVNGSAVKDAGIIVFCQRIFQYQVAGYRSVNTIACHLSDSEGCQHIDFDAIADRLEHFLDEYQDADAVLTDIAEGSFFSQGINEEAEREKQK